MRNVFEYIKNSFEQFTDRLTNKPLGELLKELKNDVKGTFKRSNISMEAKGYLYAMDAEITKLMETEQAYRNEKITRLLIGGLIAVLAHEDQKYLYTGKNQLLPGLSLDDLMDKYKNENQNKNLQQPKDEQPLEDLGIILDTVAVNVSQTAKPNEEIDTISFMTWLGMQIMLGKIAFTSDDLKREILTINNITPTIIFSELAAHAFKIDKVISTAKPVIKSQLHPEYVSAYKQGAAIGFFSNPAFKQPLLIDISKYIAKNFLNKQDAYNMARTTRKARIYAIEAREEAIKNDTPSNNASSKDNSPASHVTM